MKTPREIQRGPLASPGSFKKGTWIGRGGCGAVEKGGGRGDSLLKHEEGPDAGVPERGDETRGLGGGGRGGWGSLGRGEQKSSCTREGKGQNFTGLSQK